MKLTCKNRTYFLFQILESVSTSTGITKLEPSVQLMLWTSLLDVQLDLYCECDDFALLHLQKCFAPMREGKWTLEK